MLQVESERPAARPAGQTADDTSPLRGGSDLVLEGCDDDESTPLAYDIFVVPADFTLEELHARWRNGSIAMPNLEGGTPGACRGRQG